MNGVGDAGYLVGQYNEWVDIGHGEVELLPRGFRLQGDVLTPVHMPGAHATVAYGVNVHGHVVGCYWVDEVSYGFVMRDGAYESIHFIGIYENGLFGINDHGEMVGYVYDSEVGFRGLLVGADGSRTFFDVPGGVHTFGRGINNNGQVVGSVLLPEYGGDRGFLLDNGVFTILQAPNNRVTEAYNMTSL